MRKKKDNSRALHSAISWGASIVIIGVLFKILHIGGVTANYMIGIGLGVEAFLFFLMGFNPPEKELDWTRVFPQLNENYQGDLPLDELQRFRGNAEDSTTAKLDKMFADANINPDLIDGLGAGLHNLNEKLSAIHKISDVSLATDEFIAKLRVTYARLDTLGLDFEKASADLASLSRSDINTPNYQEQIYKLTNNLQRLNKVYELELHDSANHLQSMNKFYENLSSTMQNFNESLDDSKAFKEEVSKLSKNLNALNAVYGNMLGAMNQPRV